MNSPRVTEKDVDAAIISAVYVVLPDGRTTICMLTLDNGFTIRGESSCVCLENYKQAIGEEFAYKDARAKVWAFLGFRLADRLAAAARGPCYRDAGSGEFVSAEYARAHPSTTVREG